MFDSDLIGFGFQKDPSSLSERLDWEELGRIMAGTKDRVRSLRVKEVAVGWMGRQALRETEGQTC